MATADPARRFFLLLLVASAVLLTFVAAPLASPLFLAATFAGAVWPLQAFLTKRIGGRSWLAATVLVFVVVVLIIGPVVSFSAFAVSEGARGYDFLTETLRGEGARNLVNELPVALRRLGHDALDQLGGSRDLSAAIQKHVTSRGPSAARAVGATLTATGSFVFQTVMMLVAFYFFLVHGQEIVAWLDDLSPLRRGQTPELLKEFKKVSLAVLVSLSVTATVQAVAAIAGFLLTGVPHPFFFGGLSFFAAFIPAVGAAVISLGAAVVLLITGHPVAAAFLASWGLLVVGLVDNLIKPLLIKRGIQMNAGVVFFSLMGGLVAFGGVGLLLGPLVVALFLSLLRMYQRDYRAPLSERTSQTVF